MVSDERIALECLPIRGKSNPLNWGRFMTTQVLSKKSLNNSALLR